MLSKESGVMDLTEWLLINFEDRSNASDVDTAIDLIWEEKIDHDTFLAMSDDKIDEVFSSVSNETRKEFKTLAASVNENITLTPKQRQSELNQVSSKEEEIDENNHERSVASINSKLCSDLDDLELSDSSESSIMCNKVEENGNIASTRSKDGEDNNEQVEINEDNHKSSEASLNCSFPSDLNNLDNIDEFSDNSEINIMCKEEENRNEAVTRGEDKQVIDEKKQSTNQSKFKDNHVGGDAERAQQQQQQRKHAKGSFAVKGMALSGPILESLLLVSGAVLAALAFPMYKKTILKMILTISLVNATAFLDSTSCHENCYATLQH